jgi:zinc protease
MLSVPFTKTVLGNGLQLIVHEDRRVPLAAVNVWYHVGSKNERRGLTGLAHLFEHLMFEGSAHQVDGYFGPLQQAGAALNGSTSTDRTNYWEVVPAGSLELALWMEADRMGWLLPALSAERLENQLGVVLNERRQSYENRPYGLAQFALMAELYPREHPYSWPTIGDPEDLRAATLEDVRAFFSRYYHPANASLTVAGDVDTDEVIRSVERLFGDIPAGLPVSLPVAPRPAAAAQRIVLRDRVELPRLYLAWHSPLLFGDGDAELDLAADILGNGRTSRLYHRLIHERRIAVELGAGQSSRELGGTFQIVASAAPGHSLDEIEQAIREEVERLANDGPTVPELERGRVQAEAAFHYRLQSLGGFGGRADQLNAYNVYQGHPDGFAGDLSRYLSVSAGSLQAAVGKWLARQSGVALAVLPEGSNDQFAGARTVERGPL